MMNYLLAVLPLIGGALTSPLAAPDDGSTESLSGLEEVTTTQTQAPETVTVQSSQWVTPEIPQSTNLGSTVLTTSLVTSYASQLESTSATGQSSTGGDESNNSWMRSEKPSSGSSTSETKHPESTTEEPKPTSTTEEKPKTTEFKPPDNDKKGREKVEKAAKDVKGAGLFALWSSNVPMKWSEGSESEAKAVKGDYKWILLDDKVTDKEYHFTSTHLQQTNDGDMDVVCTLKLHPAPAGRFAWLHATAQNPWYQIQDSDCIVEVDCGGDWERDDGCTAT
ncbi:hypothetical protein I302_103782 [Kwoniella bestiolae CBS 10118]|uniref:Uncharacterized protein n=1 Tax=Kwoniella bestiolae CBS 10118 TaxID=1296100 RepID=A0A1B9G9D2_9TREE|nr:hypothetical protein I302_02486 [Kwoniella bestiolae CBS 10118]OCF27642.1 hypothetical protein I302_02486 [Kwoniella bestiolae CBS 10118]